MREEEEDKEEERKKNFLIQNSYTYIFFHYLFLCDVPSSIFYKTFSNLLLSLNSLIQQHTHCQSRIMTVTQRNWEILENFCPNS